MQLGRTPFVVALAFVLGSSAVADAAIVMPPVAQDAVVRTLAGDGTAGIADGPQGKAEFMFPAGLAYDAKNGVVYVADAAAQRVRAIAPDGTVATVAGSGAPTDTGLEVPGGFADGPAASARFNFPMAVAVAADGTLYVADSMNRCIRKIANGTVSTYAGACGRQGTQDGPAASATFSNPRGLALAEDGTLFVADFGDGVRAIAPDGAVRTLRIPSQWAREVSTVALWERGDRRMLFAAANAGFFRYNLVYNRLDGARSSSDVERMTPYGLLALSDQAVAVSSPRWSSIGFLHFGGTWRRIAGEGGQDPALLGGFADGPPAVAKFYQPLGLAAGANGEILVADAGNRRVRGVPPVDPRWTVDYGTATPPKEPFAYHVFFVSNSFAFENVVWADSIPGIVEKRLNAERGRIGLTKPIKIDVGYFDAAPLDPQAQYIGQSLADGTVDLVIWNLNPHFFHDATGDWEVALPQFTQAAEARWRAAVDGAYAKLKAAHAKLLIVDEPLGQHLGPGESYAYREFLSYDKSQRLGYDKFGQQPRKAGYGYETNVEMERFIGSLDVPSIPTLQHFLEYERTSHVPLYSNYDFHFAPAGDAFLADLIARYLETARPWSAK
jgi:DNA-binding beta-propeller fold protein YncE